MRRHTLAVALLLVLAGCSALGTPSETPTATSAPPTPTDTPTAAPTPTPTDTPTPSTTTHRTENDYVWCGGLLTTTPDDDAPIDWDCPISPTR